MMIHDCRKRVNTFYGQNVLMTAMPPELGRRSLSGRGQRSIQQPATPRTYENKRLACGILSGKVARGLERIAMNQEERDWLEWFKRAQDGVVGSDSRQVGSDYSR